MRIDWNDKSYAFKLTDGSEFTATVSGNTSDFLFVTLVDNGRQMFINIKSIISFHEITEPASRSVPDLQLI